MNTTSNYKLDTYVGCFLEREQSQRDPELEAYKSATIALAVIAAVSIAINVLLAILLLRKMSKKG